MHIRERFIPKAPISEAEKQARTFLAQNTSQGKLLGIIPAISVPVEDDDGTGSAMVLADTQQAVVVISTPTSTSTTVVVAGDSDSFSEDDEIPEGSKDLQNALLQYQEMGLSPALDIDARSCSWQDVFEQMEQAQIDFESKKKHLQGMLAHMWRTMGKREADVTPWIGLIPDVAHMDVLKAGLCLLFKLAKKSSDKKESILEQFGKIPFIIIQAQVMRKRFPRNKDLRTRCIQMYVALLQSISNLIGFLLPEKQAKKVLFFFNRRASTKQVETIVKSVATEADELERLAKNIWEELLLEIGNGTKENNELAKENNKMAKKNNAMNKKNNKLLLGVNDTFSQGMKSVSQKMSYMSQGLTSASQDISTAKDGISELLVIAKHFSKSKQDVLRQHDQQQAENGIVSILSDVFVLCQRQDERIRYMEDQQSRSRAQTPEPRGLQAPSLLTPEYLIDFLCIRPNQVADDLRAVLKEGTLFSHTAMSQAHTLLQYSAFRAWADPAHPALLLVNGHMETSGSERLSALSYVCASLVASINRVQPEAVLLTFFCGLHTTRGVATDPEDANGPNGMLRSLLWQLFMAMVQRQPDDIDLNFVDSRDFRDAIQNSRIGALGEVFVQLLRQLPWDLPVYCLVDDIEWHEQDGGGWSGDLLSVIERFCDCTKDRRLHPMFKVLLTSSHQSRCVGPRLLREEDCVDLRQDGGGDVGGLTSDRLMDEQTEKLQQRRGGTRYSDRPTTYESSDDDYEWD